MGRFVAVSNDTYIVFVAAIMSSITSRKLTDCSYFALVRHGSPWLGPRHGSSSFSLDKDAVVCSFLNSQGKHLVLLGVSGVANVTTLLRSSGSGSVKLHVSRNSFTSR